MMQHVFRCFISFFSKQLIFHMMIRTEQYCPVGDHTKCFLNTETVLSLHQHFASGCIASGE